MRPPRARYPLTTSAMTQYANSGVVTETQRGKGDDAVINHGAEPPRKLEQRKGVSAEKEEIDEAIDN